MVGSSERHLWMLPNSHNLKQVDTSSSSHLPFVVAALGIESKYVVCRPSPERALNRTIAVRGFLSQSSSVSVYVHMCAGTDRKQFPRWKYVLCVGFSSHPMRAGSIVQWLALKEY